MPSFDCDARTGETRCVTGDESESILRYYQEQSRPLHEEIARLESGLTKANGEILVLTDTVTVLTSQRDRAMAELRSLLDTWESAW